MTTKRILWITIALSLIPGLFLAVRRVEAEGASRTVTMVMDEEALAEQAEYLGVSSFELGQRYGALGLNGIALYEDTFESAEAEGRILMMSGTEARNLALSLGEPLETVPADSTLVSEVEAGALGPILAKNLPAPEEIRLGGHTWYAYPGDGRARPAGPDREAVERWAEAGFDLAYRPRNFPNLVGVGEDFPAEAHYLIHAGLQVAGHPGSLSDLVAASQDYLTGIIEGTPQDGMAGVSSKIPTTRLLSFNQDYINQRLYPRDLIDKYLLAANERGVRILYLRPYTEEQLGSMVENTEKLVSGLRGALEAEGYEVGPLETLTLDYQTNVWLRGLSAVGIVAGLGLLALLYPGGWGPFVAVSVLSLGILAGGLDWDALALAAALAFPVIGYGHFSKRLTSLGLATLVSLAGAVLLAAVGSDREAMLAITPFAGVAATLIVPPALFAFHYALKYRPPVRWLTDFWRYPVRIGDVALVMLGVLALAVVFLRRGNFPIIGVSGAELAVRDRLAEWFVRPRFKELLGHPLAVLALANGEWPAWLQGVFLTGGVVAQASILNSFSHYHTPLLISLQRTLVALALGLLVGLVLLPMVRLATGGVRRWLAGAKTPQRA